MLPRAVRMPTWMQSKSRTWCRRFGLRTPRLGWWLSSSPQRSGGSSATSVATGASLDVTFEGSVVRLLASTGPNRGIVSVSVDGVETLVDMYAPTYSYQEVVFEQVGLSAGAHTLKVVNTGTANAASSGTYADLDAVEVENVVPAVRFENTEVGLVFSSGWWLSSSPQRSGGSSATSVATGASLDVTFEGSVVRLLASTGPNRGIVSVSVDGVETLVDMYAPTYSYQEVVFEQVGLSAGAHTLKVVNTGTANAASSGTYADLDAVEVENVVPAVRFENTEVGLVFSSGWWLSSSPQRSGGSSATSVATGASLDVTFEGSVVRLLASTGPNRGIVSVSVDGVETLVDMYAPTYSYQEVVFEQVGLSAGAHTLKVVNTGTANAASSGTYADLDAVEVENVVPAVRFENTEVGLVFSSGWWLSSSPQRSGGSSATSVATGASLDVTFEGSVVRLLASTGPNRGIVSVSVDGVETLVDMYAPTYSYQEVVFEQVGLSAGAHTLKVVNTGTANAASSGTYADLDAVEVENVVPAVRFENTEVGLVFSSGWWLSSSPQRSGGSS